MVEFRMTRPESKMAEAIFEALVTYESEDWRRPHLGASVIGSDCMRELWYTFRWAARRTIDGRVLRIFRRGKDEELRVVEDLKLAGFIVDEVDPGTGRQWHFTWLSGHVAGSADGLIAGVIGAPKAKHLLEIKTMNAKRFGSVSKKGVATAEPGYYVQMQVYLRGFREMKQRKEIRETVDRALFVAVCKDNDEIYFERIHYDSAFAATALHKAGLTLELPEPPERISEKPDWYECHFCDYRRTCQLGEYGTLERNCRTCLSSTPVEGGWVCELHGNCSLSVEEQRRGCDQHLFIPGLLNPPLTVDDADPQSRKVIYRRSNGERWADHGCTLSPLPEQ